jgi:peptidyl-prolyl cis-trans isomerase C
LDRAPTPLEKDKTVRHLFKSLPLAALLGGLAIGALAQGKPTADTVVATVNGTDITLGHMILVRETLPQQYDQYPDEVLYDGILEQLIQQTLVAQSGPGVDTRRIKAAIDNERRALLATVELEKTATAAATEEAIQAAYAETYLNADLGKEWNASHILVETEDEAKALITELDAGADFAALAREKSTGPSGPSGGELGWFGPGMMVEPFETAVAAMEAGTHSAPVQTQFGCHVIRLNEVRSTQAPDLEQVREEMVNKVQADAVRKMIDQLTESATVTRAEAGSIPVGILRETDLLEN